LVYSKKVEYLYNLAFQALEFITAKKKAKQQDDDDNATAVAGQQGEAEDAAFLSLDDFPRAQRYVVCPNFSFECSLTPNAVRRSGNKHRFG